jgi:hypothetical protein
MTRAYRQSVKDEIRSLLRLLLEDAQILKHLLVHVHLLVESDRVLAQKVERDLVRRLERDVLAAQRAAAHRVCLVLALLVARTQSEHVDQVHCGRSLPNLHGLVFESFRVVSSNTVDMVLKSAK